jgi:hypothetical protein
MEMFLMGLAMSLLGIAVSAMAFSAAVRDDGERDERPRDDRQPSLPIGLTTLPEDSFFADDRMLTGKTVVPIEVLRLQIEHHVRLEQAAAEAFHQQPTHEALHVQTVSPLVH